jgi:hypothetical protein
MVNEQGEQDNDRDWNTQQPEKNASTHDALLSLFLVWSTRRAPSSSTLPDSRTACVGITVGITMTVRSTRSEQGKFN